MWENPQTERFLRWFTNIKLLGDDIGGIAVHIAARLLGVSGPGEVLVSSTVNDLVVGPGITFKTAARMPSKACLTSAGCSPSRDR
jgi:class 3 adenylate cyclase